MYKKILSLTWETEGTLYILSHLAKELEQFEIAYDYTRKYQKQWPNNPEILTILAQAEVALGNRKDAIQTLIKLKNLTPYNQEISDMIQKLVLEEELAGNFNSTQQ
jgi:tetratricopeptide (TPR) repeat protein